MLDIHPRTLVEVAEQCADGRADPSEVRTVRYASSIVEGWHPAGAACNAAQLTVPGDAVVAAPVSAKQAIRAVSGRVPDDPDEVAPNDPDIEATELAAQALLLRDIFGNPFRPFALDLVWLAWNDHTVERMARLAYEDRQLPGGHLDPHRLAVLADALEEAGCTNADILNHCRQGGEHVRGCWVVDALTGKS